RDLDGDKESGRKTIAILIGRDHAIRFLASLFILAYGLIIIFVWMNILPIWSFIVFISIGLPKNVITQFKANSTPLTMMPAMAATGKTNTVYGLLLSLALLIENIVAL